MVDEGSGLGGQQLPAGEIEGYGAEVGGPFSTFTFTEPFGMGDMPIDHIGHPGGDRLVTVDFGEEADLQIIDVAAHTLDPFDRTLGGQLLKVIGEVTAKPDNAGLDRDADVGGVDTGFPVELIPLGCGASTPRTMGDVIEINPPAARAAIIAGAFPWRPLASASLPGLFPPKMIAVESQGRLFEEMHVDGGTISPLFIAPEPWMLAPRQGAAGRSVQVYALVNTTLDAGGVMTAMSLVPILMRSFELMLKASYRNALRAVAAFCEINGFALHTASVPPELGGVGMLRFEGPAMTEMFDRGARAAREGKLWSTIAAPASRAVAAVAPRPRSAPFRQCGPSNI